MPVMEQSHHDFTAPATWRTVWIIYSINDRVTAPAKWVWREAHLVDCCPRSEYQKNDANLDPRSQIPTRSTSLTLMSSLRRS